VRTLIDRAGRAMAGALVLACLVVAQQDCRASRIEADRNKTYHLGKKHGPCMIKVASFSGLTEQQAENSREAASQLVYLLRKKGIPAYVYQQEERVEDVPAVDRLNRSRRRAITTQHAEIVVLAGNYGSVDDKVAQQTLQFIKKLSPKVMVELKGREVEWPVPLQKAFLSRNPLLTPEELAQRTRDPLLLKLNSGVQYSLLENKGKYTLVVATFNGNSVIKPQSFKSFDRGLEGGGSAVSLDAAGKEAMEVATILRNQHNLEAYVWHERYRSIVTVGSFRSPHDPQIAKLVEMCKAKHKQDPHTRQEVLVAESVQLPRKPNDRSPPKSWLLDAEPVLMDVPRW